MRYAPSLLNCPVQPACCAYATGSILHYFAAAQAISFAMYMYAACPKLEELMHQNCANAALPIYRYSRIVDGVVLEPEHGPCGRVLCLTEA